MLQTLGKLRLLGTDFGRPVPLLILCYLTYKGGKHDREDLAELLFPIAPPDETILSTQAQQIVDQIYEAKLTGNRAKVQLAPFSKSGLNIDDVYAAHRAAHQQLQLNGFITTANVTGVKGNYWFTYKLTPSFFVQCKGLDPLSVSLNKLKSHLHNLSALEPAPISRTSRFVESLTTLDLHEVRDWMSAGEVKIDFQFSPFLDRVESLLQKEKFQLGTRLAAWIERTRIEVSTELFQHFATHAVGFLANDPAKGQQCAVKALHISKSSQLEDANYEPVITVLATTGYAHLEDQLAFMHPTTQPRESHLETSKPLSNLHPKQRAWLLSQEHLGSLLESEASGDQAASSSSVRGKYNADTYVETADDERLRSFLTTEKQCLLVLGKSGTGKTSLLCHRYLEHQKGEDIAVFLSARLLTTAEFGSYLQAHVWPELFREASPAPGQTSQVTLYIDAVNEFSYSGNPVMLLHSIAKWVQDVDNTAGPKIIFSCRVETWREYLEIYATEPHYIEILNITSFTTPTAKAKLYQHYQRYYRLYPTNYKSLSKDVTQLIETPFLMRMIAETYSNRTSTKVSRKIPRSLNYFEVFLLLTDYKREDALRLLAPTEPKKALFESELQQCLLAFAALVYRKVSGSVLSRQTEHDTTDAIDSASLQQTQFATFMAPFSEHSVISPFQALVQLNLISETVVTKLNFWGRPSSVVAYKFFHDQYTQFCLSAVLRETVLGSIANVNLSRDSHELVELGNKLSTLLGEAGQTPLIAGAVEHWFHGDIFGGTTVSLPIPLFDFLASKESGSVFYYLASFLHGLIDKNVLTPKKLYESLFRRCSVALKIILANHLLELWPSISKQHLTAFMAALDNQRDAEVLRTLADNFVELFNVYPHEVTRLLDNTLKGGEDFPKALKHVIVSRSEAFNHAAFVTSFAAKAIISNATSVEKVRIVHSFLEQKYRLLLNVLISKKPGVFAVLQNFLYRRLEELGTNQWNQAVGVQGENNLFFVENRGVVQQDLLRSFYPYMVAIHNKEYDTIKFDGGEFEQLTLRMLGFEAGSVIGYEAAMMTSAALAENLIVFEDVVDKLLEANNPAHLFFLNLILSIYAYIDPSKIATIMQELNDTIVPHLARHGAYPEKIIGGILGVTAIDFPSSRQHCEGILNFISQDVKCSGHQARVQELTSQLVKCIFHPNIETARFLVKYVIKQQWLDDSFLAPCAWNVMAGVFVRNTSVLTGELSSLDNHERILQDVKQNLTKELYAKRDSMSYQTIWNRFMSSAFKTTKVRYYLIKILTGGLLQSNNVQEYTLEFRRLLVEMLRGYMTETEIDYTHFTVEEAMLETEPKYVKGKGEQWVSQPRQPTRQ